MFLYSQAVLYEVEYASPPKLCHTNGETYSRIGCIFLFDDSQDVDERIYCLLRDEGLLHLCQQYRHTNL